MKVVNKIATLIFFFTLLSFRSKADDCSLSSYVNSPAAYPAEVVDQWLALNIRIMSSTIASFNGPFVRIYSYGSIAAYLAIYPGLPADSKYRLQIEKLDQFPGLPEASKNEKYHWPSSVNAALAGMTRAMFPYTNPLNKASIDSLEKAFEKKFQNEADTGAVRRAVLFGREVSQIVYRWSETDGYHMANRPFEIPKGPGKWEPTPPNFAKPVTPYWGNLRTIIKGSIDNTQPPPPPEYSEEQSSQFYKMIDEVYKTDVSLTTEQKNIALFWRDINPGISAPGHWMNILRQVFQKEGTSLDKAVFTYALTGIALNDAWISCWKTRYEYNLLRPVTYIRNVMKQKDWSPYLVTPPHPEYTSGFAAMAGAITQALTVVYGNRFTLTDHTYDYLGMQPRRFDSFSAMAEEAGMSKFYGGIHYKVSVDYGLWQGREVAMNISEVLLNRKGNGTR